MKQENIEKLIKDCLLKDSENKETDDIAKLIFDMETMHGLPAEITVEELMKKNIISGLPSLYLIVPVVFKYLTLKVEHSLKSGMKFMGKGHLRMIENNQKIISNLLETGKIETL